MNIHYVVYRKADGVIMQAGMCQKTVINLIAKAGEDVLTFDDPPVVDGMRVRNGVLESVAIEQPAAHWTVQRRHAYPGAEVLADALYWQAKGDNTKMLAYIAAVEAVKQQYPKGVE